MRRVILFTLLLAALPALLFAAPEAVQRKRRNSSHANPTQNLMDVFSNLTAKAASESGASRKDLEDIDTYYISSQGIKQKPFLFHKKYIKPAARKLFISFEMEQSDPEEGGYGILYFERGELRYPLYADKLFHVYNWEAFADDGRDLGNLLGLTFTSNSQQLLLRKFHFPSTLRGDADVMVLGAGPAYILPGADGKATFNIHFRNTGGTATSKLKFNTLNLPAGVKIPRESREELPRISPNQSIFVSVEVNVTREHDGKWTIKYSAKDVVAQSQQGRIFTRFRSPLPAEAIRPVATSVPVGAFFRTKPIPWREIRKNAPFFLPVYGEYSPGDPEFVAWQTRHLAENGISFLFADWYWEGGRRKHTEWENAFRNSDAAKQKAVSFAPIWRDFSDSIGDEEFFAAINALIETHFKQESAFRIDEKPVLVLPLLTGENMKPLFDRADEMARKAGLPGICLIALVTSEQLDRKDFLQLGAGGGINLVVCENPLQPVKKPDDFGRLPYPDIADASRKRWNDIRKMQNFQLIPTLSCGFDETPALGVAAGFVVNRNKDTFYKHCKDAQSYSLRQPVKLAMTGPLNDWENGSFLEPDEQYGFDFYEAIREVFGVKGEARKMPENLFPLMQKK